MDKLITFIILILLSGSTNAANQVEVSGNIKSMRTQTSHHTNTASHGEVILQLSAPLENGCNWLSVERGNSSAVSFLLTAMSQNKSVRIWYYSDVKSAAWGSACQLVNIELK